MNFDQKALIKTFFTGSEKPLNNWAKTPNQDKINNSFDEENAPMKHPTITKLPNEKKKKTPPLEIINEVNTEDNTGDNLNIKSFLNKTCIEVTKQMSIEKQNQSSKLNKNSVSPYKRNYPELMVEGHCEDENYTLESNRIKLDDKSIITTNLITSKTKITNKVDLTKVKSIGKLSTVKKNVTESWKTIDITGIVNDKTLPSFNESKYQTS